MNFMRFPPPPAQSGHRMFKMLPMPLKQLGFDAYMLGFYPIETFDAEMDEEGEAALWAAAVDVVEVICSSPAVVPFDTYMGRDYVVPFQGRMQDMRFIAQIGMDPSTPH